eukprot:3933353-Rhodomonas_salina.1
MVLSIAAMVLQCRFSESGGSRSAPTGLKIQYCASCDIVSVQAEALCACASCSLAWDSDAASGSDLTKSGPACSVCEHKLALLELWPNSKPASFAGSAGS